MENFKYDFLVDFQTLCPKYPSFIFFANGYQKIKWFRLLLCMTNARWLAYLWQDLYFNDFLLLIGIGVGQTRRDRGFSRGVHQSTTMKVIVGKMVSNVG